VVLLEENLSARERVCRMNAVCEHHTATRSDWCVQAGLSSRRPVDGRDLGWLDEPVPAAEVICRCAANACGAEVSVCAHWRV
jgi:hypothetical protein